MKRIVVNESTATVWIDGAATTTTASVAKLVNLLLENQDQLVSNEKIQAHLNITENTRYAYLRGARDIVEKAGGQIRAIKGEGVVLESAQVEVGA